MSSSTSRYHHGDLPRALETAAMQLLERTPAGEISLRAVARAANVSHNAPYHHFADRNGLLKVLAERSMEDFVAAVQHAADEAHDPQIALRDVGIAYIRFAVERPFAFDAIYDPTVCVPGDPTPTMAPLIDQMAHVISHVSVRVGLESVADSDALWGLVHGLGTLAAAGHLTAEQAVAAYETAAARLARS